MEDVFEDKADKDAGLEPGGFIESCDNLGIIISVCESRFVFSELLLLHIPTLQTSLVLFNHCIVRPPHCQPNNPVQRMQQVLGMYWKYCHICWEWRWTFCLWLASKQDHRSWWRWIRGNYNYNTIKLKTIAIHFGRIYSCYSSVGRAQDWRSWGHWFDPGWRQKEVPTDSLVVAHFLSHFTPWTTHSLRGRSAKKNASVVYRFFPHFSWCLIRWNVFYLTSDLSSNVGVQITNPMDCFFVKNNAGKRRF